jgi:Rhodopirellula transposase DDE domain
MTRRFVPINKTVARAIEQGQPAISVDTKEREMVGISRPWARSLSRRGRTHDFKDEELTGCSTSLTRDEGWVNVGSTAAQFAAASIKGWWEQIGCERYPDARSLTITADSGGSNSHRTRL